MAVTINGTTGISTPGLSSTADVTLAGAAVELLNNSGRIVVGQAGSVLQVVQYTNGTPFSTTSGSPVTTGFTRSITPSSTSSKVLVIATSSLGVPTTGMNGSVLLYRDATQLTTTAAPSAVTYGAAAFNQNQFTAIYLDSPATTSSTAYAMFAYRDGVAGTFYVGARSDGTSPMLTTITLMEIAA